MAFADCTPTGPDQARALLEIGPGILVLVGAPSAADPQIAENPQQHAALIDTGATYSCIDQTLATALSLPKIDRVKIGGATGASDHDVFLAVVNVQVLGRSQYGRFAGVDLAGGGQIHRVLLGRSFLAGMLLVYDGMRSQVTLGI